jgi:hypothetical protein
VPASVLSDPIIGQAPCITGAFVDREGFARGKGPVDDGLAGRDATPCINASDGSRILC